MRRVSMFAAILGLGGLGWAQSEPVPASVTNLKVPVYVSPDGEMWAVGPGYKVSFHDGVAFYPYLGSTAPAHLPLRWRTSRVVVGGQPQELRPVAAERVDPWRVEYRRDGFAEVYEIRDGGLEQSFVFARAPGTGGDLVVEGRLRTPLAAPATSDHHGALRFADSRGTPIIEYGAAFVFDAAGRRADLATDWDGETVRLTVPATWLADAVYPVTVDPLWAPVVIQAANAQWGAAGRPELVNVSSVLPHATLVFLARPWTATDWDCFAYTVDTNFVVTATVYVDTSTLTSTRHVACSFVGGTQRWVMVHDQQSPTAPPISSSIRVAHVPHDLSGPLATLDLVSIEPGDMLLRPDVGGISEVSSGDNVFVVCEEQTASSRKDVNGYLIDTRNNAYLAGYRLDSVAPGAGTERSHPSINQVSLGGSEQWLAVWQSRSQGTDPWSIRGGLIDPVGGVSISRDFGPITSKHVIRPRVAGERGHFLITYVASDSASSDFGDQVYTERVAWSDPMAVPQKLHLRLVANASGSPAYRNSDVAADFRNPRMYAMAWQGTLTGGTPNVQLARLGATGAVVEWQRIDNAVEPGITYETQVPRFLTAYGVVASSDPVVMQRFIYDPNAANIYSGTSCGGRIHTTYLPYAGLSSYGIRLDQVPPGTLSWLLLASSPANVPLDPLGMFGCHLYVGGTVITLPAVADPTGLAGVPVPLPDAPLAIGDFYAQWLHASSANPFGLASSQGLKVQVR